VELVKIKEGNETVVCAVADLADLTTERGGRYFVAPPTPTRPRRSAPRVIVVTPWDL